jgi:hypothetical protein
MKKLLSIILIIATVIQSTSELWILVSFKINQEYIATNLCINRFDAIPVCKGSCFLEKQINQDQKQKVEFSNLKMKELNLFCQHNIFEISNPLLKSSIAYPLVNDAFYKTGYICLVFRPPSLLI